MCGPQFASIPSSGGITNTSFTHEVSPPPPQMWPESDHATITLNLLFSNQIWVTFICGSKSDTGPIFWNGTSVWTNMRPISEFTASFTSPYIDIPHNYAQAKGGVGVVQRKTNMEDSCNGGQWRDSEVLYLISTMGDTCASKTWGVVLSVSVSESISKEKWKFNHYPLTTMPMEVWLKGLSPQNTFWEKQCCSQIQNIWSKWWPPLQM